VDETFENKKNKEKIKNIELENEGKEIHWTIEKYSG
jgi:hypothetical protein